MQTDIKFPKTIKAAKQHDLTGWALGDALLAECKDQDHGPMGYSAVVAELKDYGIELNERYLRLLRQTAEDFPKARRYDGEHNTPLVTLRAHTAAGNPDTLDMIVRVTPRDGRGRISKDYIEDVMRQARDEERKQRTERREQARKEAAEADSEEKTAIKRRDHATTNAEREEAQRQRERAKQKKQEAQERAKSNKGAPPRRERLSLRDSDVGPLAAKAFFMKSARQAENLAGRALKKLDPHIDDLSPAAIDGLKDAAMTVANEWRQTATKLGQPKGRGHLSVVNE